MAVPGRNSLKAAKNLLSFSTRSLGINEKPLWTLIFLGGFIAYLSLVAANIQAAAIATVGQDDGYSGRILDKIAAKWKPPKQLVGTHKLRLILSVDGEGELLDCKVQKGSGLEALDVSACAAARAAAPFGSPPYGMPATVHFSFWSGGLDSRVAVKDEKERVNTAYAERAAENSRFANERAQARAQVAAKSSGKKLPGEKTALSEANSGNNRLDEKNVEKVPASFHAAGNGATKSINAESASHETAQDYKAYPYRSKEKYISKITWDLRNAMFVPVQAKPGTYHATVRVECDKAGNIISSDMIRGSGDQLLDKYVLQGIARARKIVPPAEEFGNTFDLTFNIVRQAKGKKKNLSVTKQANGKIPQSPSTSQQDNVQ